MTLKVGYGVEKSIGKPNSLLSFMEWIVDGTGIAPIKKNTEKGNSYSFYYIFLSRMQLVCILVLLEFLLPYSVIKTQKEQEYKAVRYIV